MLNRICGGMQKESTYALRASDVARFQLCLVAIEVTVGVLLCPQKIRPQFSRIILLDGVHSLNVFVPSACRRFGRTPIIRAHFDITWNRFRGFVVFSFIAGLADLDLLFFLLFRGSAKRLPLPLRGRVFALLRILLRRGLCFAGCWDAPTLLWRRGWGGCFRRADWLSANLFPIGF